MIWQQGTYVGEYASITIFQLRRSGMSTKLGKWLASATILWDMPVNTDNEMRANRPGIIIKDKKEKKCIMIDMSMPSERNVSIWVIEKLSKYKDLAFEVTKMFQLKTSTVPIVVRALGLIEKGLDRYINQIPGHMQSEELQKIALLGSLHILRRTLSIKSTLLLP